MRAMRVVIVSKHDVTPKPGSKGLYGRRATWMGARFTDIQYKIRKRRARGDTGDYRSLLGENEPEVG